MLRSHLREEVPAEIRTRPFRSLGGERNLEVREEGMAETRFQKSIRTLSETGSS